MEIVGHTDEGGVRSPFVIKWGDKISGGKKINTIAHAIDLYPTLTDLSGIKPVNELPFDGINLANILLGKTKNSEERILYSYWKDKLSLRNQQFRLDKDNQLFDMQKDLSQNNNVADQYPEDYQRLISAKEQWEKEVLSELSKSDERTFPIAHPDFSITQLPARDAKTTGSILRSNRWPNCSFYTNWKNETDSIYWDVEILSDGLYEPIVYYTCSEKNIGHSIHLSNDDKLLESQKIEIAFNPPLRGMEYDRMERGESYVKDWATLKLPPVNLKKELSRLTLTVSGIQDEQASDFRLMTLRRLD